jgi:hypothetical protein
MRDVWNMLQAIEDATGAQASLRVSTKLHDLMPPAFVISVVGIAAGSKTRVFAEQVVTIEMMSEGDHVLRHATHVISEIWNREEKKTQEVLGLRQKEAGGYQPDGRTPLNPTPPQGGSGVPKKEDTHDRHA